MQAQQPIKVLPEKQVQLYKKTEAPKEGRVNQFFQNLLDESESEEEDFLAAYRQKKPVVAKPITHA